VLIALSGKQHNYIITAFIIFFQAQAKENSYDVRRVLTFFVKQQQTIIGKY
jgi:hypothetical protein